MWSREPRPRSQTRVVGDPRAGKCQQRLGHDDRGAGRHRQSARGNAALAQDRAADSHACRVPAIGYTITAQFQSAGDQPSRPCLERSFPLRPPATLAVGFSASTGGSTNNHELHGLITATPDDLQVTMSGPSSILQGASITYDVTLTNKWQLSDWARRTRQPSVDIVPRRSPAPPGLCLAQAERPVTHREPAASAHPT